MPPRSIALSPRKQPVQDRSRATVDAVITATIQVLVKDGYEKLTTTKVARAAGVSVGSLYQYFPTKDAVVLAVLEIHLDEIFRAMERGLAAAGPSLEEQVDGILAGLLEAKGRNPALSVALKNQVARLEGNARVRRLLGRTQALVAGALAGHPRALAKVDPAWAAFVTTAAVDGVLSSILESDPRRMRDPRLPGELRRLVMGYLRPER